MFLCTMHGAEGPFHIQGVQSREQTEQQALVFPFPLPPCLHSLITVKMNRTTSFLLNPWCGDCASGVVGKAGDLAGRQGKGQSSGICCSGVIHSVLYSFQGVEDHLSREEQPQCRAVLNTDGPIPEFSCEDLLPSLRHFAAMTNAHTPLKWKCCPSVTEVTAEGTH